MIGIFSPFVSSSEPQAVVKEYTRSAVNDVGPFLHNKVSKKDGRVVVCLSLKKTVSTQKDPADRIKVIVNHQHHKKQNTVKRKKRRRLCV
jgi:hypothetical protein